MDTVLIRHAYTQNSNYAALALADSRNCMIGSYQRWIKKVEITYSSLEKDAICISEMIWSAVIQPLRGEEGFGG